MLRHHASRVAKATAFYSLLKAGFRLSIEQQRRVFILLVAAPKLRGTRSRPASLVRRVTYLHRKNPLGQRLDVVFAGRNYD